MLWICAVAIIPGAYAAVNQITAEVVSAGNGQFMVRGQMGRFRENKRVSVLIYKTQNPDEPISDTNPLSRIAYVGETFADNYGNFEVLIPVGTKIALDQWDITGLKLAVGSEKDGMAAGIRLKAPAPDVKVTTGDFGNISFDAESRDLNITITDKEKLAQSATVKFVVYDGASKDVTQYNTGGDPYKDSTVFYETQPKTVALTDGTTTFKQEFDLGGASAIPKYGIFDVRIIVSVDGAEDKVLETTFANVRRAETLNNKMGVQNHFSLPSPSQSEEIISVFANAGYGLARDGLDINYYKTKKTDASGNVTYDYIVPSHSQKAFDALKSNNVGGIFILQGTDPGRETDNVINDDKELEVYKRYVYETVLNTLPYYSEYELMNEVNIGGADTEDEGEIYKNPRYTQDEYMTIVKIAKEQINKAVADYNKQYGTNKTVKVYAGALAYVEWQNCNTVEWVRQLFQKGVGNYIDGFTYHMYTNERMPEKSIMTGESYIWDSNIKNWKVSESIPDQIKKIISDAGYPNMPIILSETGYASCAGWKNGSYENIDGFTDINNSRSWDYGTEYRQAIYELRDFALMYNDFESIYFYNAVNKQNSDKYEATLGHLQTNHYNIKNRTGTAFAAKPVFAVMANFNALLANASLTKEEHSTVSGVDDEVYNYTFTKSDNSMVNMIWTATHLASTYDGKVGNETENNYNHKDQINKAYCYDYNYHSNAAALVVYDVYGNSRMVLPTNGVFKLKIGAAPIYVTEREADNGIFFTDLNGNDLPNGFRGNSVAVNVNKAKLSLDGDPIIVCGGYGKDGELKFCKAVKLSELESPQIMISAKDMTRVSVYILRDLNNISPLYKKTEIKKADN